jgi:hypothetical protein
MVEVVCTWQALDAYKVPYPLLGYTSQIQQYRKSLFIMFLLTSTDFDKGNYLQYCSL